MVPSNNMDRAPVQGLVAGSGVVYSGPAGLQPVCSLARRHVMSRKVYSRVVSRL